MVSTIRRFTPFGAIRGFDDDATWPNGKGFVGGTRDSTGLTHLGPREYDPDTGRFLSVDPILDLADPQSWNGYGYAGESPVTFSDPDGLTRCDVGACPTPWQNVHGPNFCETHNCHKSGAPYNGLAWADPDNDPYNGHNGRYDRRNYGRAQNYLKHHSRLAQQLSVQRMAERIAWQQEAHRRLAARAAALRAQQNSCHGWKCGFKKTAGFLALASTIAGAVPVCTVCQAVSVGLGLASAGLYAGTGDWGVAAKQLGSTAIGLVAGGTGLSVIRNFGKFGKMYKYMSSPSKIHRAYGCGRTILNNGGAVGSFQKAARGVGRGKAYQIYWGTRIQWSGTALGMVGTS
ncbi:RHS repeat-associated core domain-containing protein [Spirillospora sp. NPDC047418]